MGQCNFAFVFAAWAIGAYYAMGVIGAILKVADEARTQMALRRKIRALALEAAQPRVEEKTAFN